MARLPAFATSFAPAARRVLQRAPCSSSGLRLPLRGARRFARPLWSASSPSPDLGGAQPPAPPSPDDEDSRPPWAQEDYRVSPPEYYGSSGVAFENAMDFFRLREGKWASVRVTHFLAFGRSESGESEISMECLEKDDPRIIELLRDNGYADDAAQGGCYVTWQATLAWDQEGDNHEGSTVFALVPDADDVRRGTIIRDRGYAEIVPIAGTFYLDGEDALCLDTPYDGGAVEERFSFDGPDMVNRVSTVRRFGGLSNATFAMERRIPAGAAQPPPPPVELTPEEEELIVDGSLFLFGLGRAEPQGAGQSEQGGGAVQADTAGGGSMLAASRARIAAATAARTTAGKPSPGSAFGSGFSTNTAGAGGTGGEQQGLSQAEQKAGIDLSKVPPSMRDDFAKSMGIEMQDEKDAEAEG